MFSLEDISTEDLSFQQEQSHSILSTPDIYGSLENIQEPVEQVPQPEQVTPHAEVRPEDRTSLEEISAEVENATPVKQTTARDAMVSYMRDKIESGDFFTWNDYDEKQSLDEYLTKMPAKDLQELLDKNVDKKQNIGYEQAPVQLREALPSKMKYALDYIAQGGTDLEGLFSQLAKTTRVENLDINNEEHVPEIVRSYLHATGMVPTNLVEEQIQEWKEGGLLEKKAQAFKPLLDQYNDHQAQVIIEQRAQQAEIERQTAQMFVDNVTNTLSKYEIGGVKIPKKDANNLYYDITGLNYQGINGQPTNIIGHTLDRITYAEPDYDFLAEIAWHMRDREGFKKAMAQHGVNNKVKEVVRELKDAQYIKTQMAPAEEPAEQIRKEFKPRNILSR